MTPTAAANIFVHPDEQPEFDQFEVNLLAEMKPAGELQSHFFDQFLHAAWNIRRCLRLETEIQNEAIAKGLSDALMDDELARKLDRVYRHKKMHETAQRRAMTDLRQLQTEELWRSASQKFEQEPVLINTAKLSANLHRAIAKERKADFNKVRAKLETLIGLPPIAPTATANP